MTDKGASPVIGVILMVAITVVLAAVIAAFVFGMAENIQHTQAATQFPENATIIITEKGFSDSIGFFIDGYDGDRFSHRYYLDYHDGNPLQKIQIGNPYRINITYDYYIGWGGTKNPRITSITPINWSELPERNKP